MTVEKLLAEITSKELAEWMAFEKIEPWGETRADLRAGIIASTVANRLRGKREPARKVTEFMPEFDRRPDPRIGQSVRAAFMNFDKAKD